MKNMYKKALGLSAVLTLVAAPMVVTANTITLTQNANTSYSDGGAFQALTTQNFVQNYAASATANGQFLTFCVESQVVFSPGHSYNYITAGSSSDGKNLALGTAYLYYEFASGTLGTLAPQSLSDYGLMQAAIWTLQGQIMPNGDFTTATADNNKYYALALTAPATTGTFGVQILNLTDGNGIPAQNQLVYTGGGTPHTGQVPDGGLTITLLGLSLASMALIQRRKSVAGQI
jgi:hypothetical protein